MNDITHTLNSLLVDVAELRISQTNHESQNILLNSEIISLKSKNTSLDSEIISLKSKNTSLDSKIISLKSENEELSKEVRGLQKKVNKVISDKGTEWRKFQDSLKEKQEKIDVLMEKMGQLEKDNEEQMGDIKGHEGIIHELKGEVHDIKVQNVSLQRQVTENHNALMKIERWTIVNDVCKKFQGFMAVS